MERFTRILKAIHQFITLVLPVLGKDALPLAAAIVGAVAKKGVDPAADIAALTALDQMVKDLEAIKGEVE